ncbi:MAG: FAD-dependent thymidylate synthase [Crocinitomicaceae bacterium TMED209]|nr:MAG: FAD-dependent thymidylate synthase [Crocinitomicaceae bacterium TMED209]
MSLVKLISYSKPTNEFDNKVEDVQDLIAFCARVSNPSNQMNQETNEKLIKYLIKHQHWSPLEMVNACLEINTTRDIAHQIVRHRSFSFQEFSQRYADPKDQGELFEYSEARLQDTKNRQNSIEVEDPKLQQEWKWAQMRIAHLAKKEYDWAIKKGIAKEQARKVLPEGLTKTRLYMNGTLRSWVHYIDLRSANGTQKEHMEIAKQCAVVIAGIFPMINDIKN